MSFRVAAYSNDGMFHHWASCLYDNKDAALAYCTACTMKCSHQTGFTYKVEEE